MPFPPPPPPLFIPGESWQRIGKFPVARQGEPTIVVAVSQYIARVHGTHKNDIRWHLTMPITTNISHTQATCPPFFIPGESWQRIGKVPVVRQGEPAIVVAVSQYIARVHGTHKNDIRWHLTMPITTNIRHTQATCPSFPFFHPWRVLAKDWQSSCCETRR